MRLLVDSNVFIYAAAGVPEALAVLDRADHADWAGYSAITRLEVLGYSKFTAEEESKLIAMLDCFDECDVSKAVIDEAIRVRKIVATKAPDAIVAATALLCNASLATRNECDFRDIPGLRVLNPFVQD